MTISAVSYTLYSSVINEQKETNMLNISGSGKTFSDIEVKEFLERQRHNIKSVVEDVLDDKVIPRLDTLEQGQATLGREIKETKAASQNAHTEIIQRLERIDQRLDQMDKRFDQVDNRLDHLEKK